jgi:rRNA maturation RNase YbeY
MYLELEKVDISLSKKGTLKDSPFLSYVESLKNKILGDEYTLSISFVDKKTAKSINVKYRQKDYIPNTLSFPYSESSGEIFLQIETIYEQAGEFELSEQNFLLKIYIHSLLHLKGLDHGAKMEELEDKFLLENMI